jgi:hypothetical protein
MSVGKERSGPMGQRLQPSNVFDGPGRTAGDSVAGVCADIVLQAALRTRLLVRRQVVLY